MTFDEFRTLAHHVFDDIPPDFREGVDGLEVTRQTVPHPSLPEVFTLGECLTESYPSQYGGAGAIRSRVVLYYGSFLELARTRDDWDWEAELHETILHEVRHHLEHLAEEDELEEMDYAEDQNFARRDGGRFDPFFYQRGEPMGSATYRVEDDVFIERMVDRADASAGEAVEVEWDDRRLRLHPPAVAADVHYLRIANLEADGNGELTVVLIRRRGIRDWIRGLLGAPLTVEQTEVEAVPC